MTAFLILASASPRRRELLEEIGIECEVIPSGVDEEFLEGETPVEHVKRLSREKCSAISSPVPDAWILGADTIVLIDGEILGKPGTPDEERHMLMKLSGREHAVITGFSIINRNADVVVSDAVESRVVFKELSEDEIAWYARSMEPYDKAGGYAVQGMASCFIIEIHGSYTNVVGLPVCEVVSALKKVGVVDFSK